MRFRLCALCTAFTLGLALLWTAGALSVPTQAATLPHAPTVCPPAGAWTAAAPVPTPTDLYAFAQDGDNFYVIGGQLPNIFAGTDQVWRYQATTDTWTALAPLPMPVFLASAAVWNGKIYVTGGFDTNGQDPALLQIYDIATNRWSRGPDMVTPNIDGVMGVYNGRIYFSGGIYTSTTNTATSIFDINTNRWSQGNPAPDPFDAAGYTAVGQYLYVAGGVMVSEQQASRLPARAGVLSGVSTVLTNTRRLDMATGVWSLGPPLLQPTANTALVSDGHKLYALGGDDGNNTRAEVAELDLALWPGGTWTVSTTPLPQPHDGVMGFYSSSRAGGEIWLTGGFDEHGPTAANLYRTTGFCRNLTPTVTPGSVTPTPAPVCGTGIWQFPAPMPSPVAEAAVVAQAGMIYSFGGSNDSERLNTANRYNPDTNSWTALAPLPAAHTGMGAVSDGRYIYLINGATLTDWASATLWRYDPLANIYTTLAAPSQATSYQATVYLNGKIYRIAGLIPDNWTNSVEVYTISTDTWNTVSSYPDSAEWHTAVALNGYIYSGGGDSNNQRNKTYRYDPVTNVWDDAAVADLPVDIERGASAVLDGRWVMVRPPHDYYPNDLTDNAYVWDSAINAWTQLPPLLAREQPGAAVVGSSLYIVAGNRINNPYSTVTREATNLLQQYSETACCSTPTVTRSPVATLTATLTYTPTYTPTRTATATATRTATATVTRTPTSSPSVTPSRTPSGTVTTTPSGTVTAVATGTPSRTPTPSPSRTATPSPTLTPMFAPTASITPSPSVTRPPSATPTMPPTATPCAVAFTDVQPTDYFAAGVQYLACHGAVSGYSDGTFRPYNQTTRAQLAKIVVLGFALPLQTPTSGFTFADVPPGSTFFPYVETGAARGLVSGYTCGGTGEPCDATHHAYYRPSANVTRAQLAKIVVRAVSWALLTPPTPTFTDVPAANLFYPYIETAAHHGILSGYSDGTFRPANPATRGQIAKIVTGALTGPLVVCLVSP